MNYASASHHYAVHAETISLNLQGFGAPLAPAAPIVPVTALGGGGHQTFSDPILGGPGPDSIGGTSGDDVIKGLGGNDFLQGFDGKDTIYGGDDNDTINGGNDVDTLYGGGGDDRIQGIGGFVALTMDSPSDIIEGGTGFDTLLVNYQGFVNAADHQPATLLVDFSTGTGQVLVSGFEGENFSHMESLLIVCPDGDDVITGGKYNDRIDAYLGNDIIKAMGGDDIVSDTGGFLNADGGKGFDNMELFRVSDTADDAINCDAGTLTVGGDDMGTFKNFEWGYMSSGSGNDTIRGFNAGFNSLTGNDGNDTLIAGTQNDWLYGGEGDDRLYGGAGNDMMDGATGRNLIRGGDGDDDIRSNGTDRVDAGSGDDTLRVNPLNMVLGTQYSGGADNDTMHIAWDTGPGTYDITKSSFDGWESMVGLGYNSAGTYTLVMSVAQLMSFGVVQLAQAGGTSVIQLHNKMDVTLVADSEFNVLQLANGGQHADLSAVTSPNLPSVTGGTGDDTVVGPAAAGLSFHASLGDGADTFAGGGSNATVSGGIGNDALTGGSGVNTFSGDEGNDTLLGGSNADRLTGGADADHLDGGAGPDTFVYLGTADSTGATFDTVSHFDAKAQDIFDLATAVTGIDATVKAGNLTTADFDSDLAGDIGKAQLKAGHAALFTPTSGDYNGDTFLIVDANGQKGYQAGADYVILLDNALHMTFLDTGDFT